MNTLWQANDGFNPIEALFFEIIVFNTKNKINLIEFSKNIHKIIFHLNLKSQRFN